MILSCGARSVYVDFKTYSNILYTDNSDKYVAAYRMIADEGFYDVINFDRISTLLSAS